MGLRADWTPRRPDASLDTAGQRPIEGHGAGTQGL